MKPDKSLSYLIRYLSPKSRIPKSIAKKWILYRSLINIRKPKPFAPQMLSLQDDLLREMNQARGTFSVEKLEETAPNLIIFMGDLTTLKVDSIINSADFSKNGYYLPYESVCLDQLLHIFAGIRLRLDIEKLKLEAENLSAVETKGYNLLCDYIFHRELPNADSPPTHEQYAALRDAVSSSLKRALELELESIAIPMLGVDNRGYPKRETAENILAVAEAFLRNNSMKIVLCVESPETEEIVRELIKGMSFETTVDSEESAEDILRQIRNEEAKNNPAVPKESVEDMLSGLKNKMGFAFGKDISN